MRLIHIVFILVFIRILTLNIASPLIGYITPLLLIALFFLHLPKKTSIGNAALVSPISMINYGMLLLFFFSIMVAMSNGMNYLSSIGYFFRYLVIFCLCYFGYVSAIRYQLYEPQKWVLIILITVNVFALLSLFGIGKVELVDGIKRPVGLVGFSEVMSHLSMFSVIFSLYLLLNEKNHYNSTWLIAIYILLALSLLSLISSSTLKNILLLPFSVLLLLFFAGRSLIQLIRILFLLIIIATPVVFIFGDAFLQRAHEALSVGVDVGAEEGDVIGSSLIFRIVHWKLLLTDWYENYFYLGSGTDNVQNMKGFGHYKGLRLDAHSDFVKFVCELGVIGVSFFYLLYFRLIYLLNRLRKSVPLAGFCLTIIITFSIVAIFGKVFYSAFNLYILSILIGYSFGILKTKLQ